MIINGGTIANIENYNMLTINDISGKYILNQTGATLNILGGNIVNENQNAIKNYGNLNISGGEIFSKSTSTYYQGNGIYNEETGVVNITGGKITNIYNLNNIELISGNCQIVKNSGTFNAIGGTLYEITNYGTFNLGEKDGNVNIQSPVVTSAIYSYNKGKLNFYDGNITGSCHETNSAIHGSIGNIEDGYSIIKQKINDYNEKLYLSKETEVSIENQNYETLQDAIDSILTTSEVTIKLNRDITYIEAEQTKTIENKNIILDLNGHRIITQTSPFIINKATLKITDNSQEKTGQIESKVKDGNECIIQNEGNLEISNTNLTFMNSNSNYSNAINNKSILIIKDGTRIEYGEVAIYNEKTGTVNMQGGTINSSIGIKNYGAFAMTGGEILRDNNKGIDNYATVLLQKGTVSGYTAIKNNSGKLQIQNEAIITTNCYAIDNYATVLMEQGKIAGEITNYSGTFSMLNGQIESFIENKEGATINIKGGNVSSTRNSTINNEGNLYIEAGNVINATGIAIQNYKTVVLGNNNSTVSAISPVIDAKTYGIYNYDNATISFYDGIIKGETQHVFGAINSKPNNYEIVYSQANTVATLRLIGKTTKIASIGSTYFESVKLAVDSANSGDIIMLQSEDEIVNTITIPENLNITIDLQGFTIVGIGNNTAIENNGTLKIINSTTIKSKIQNTFETAIQNNGTLVIGINDGTIQDNIDIIGKDAAIENNGQLELYDGKLIGKQAITQNIGIIIPEGKQTYITISDGKNILAIKE